LVDSENMFSHWHKSTLQSQLGAAPVTTFGVPFDGIVRSHADPVRQRSILPLTFGRRSLGAKGLL
jgi:hypothetical protein